jgi:hypothetical protein
MTEDRITVSCVSCGLDCSVLKGIRTPLCDRPECVEARDERKKQARATVPDLPREVSEDAARGLNNKGDVETFEGLQQGVAKRKKSALSTKKWPLGGVRKNSLDKPRSDRRADLRPSSQPTFMKSVPVPLVPSPDREAPHGRDLKTDRPIGRMMPAGPISTYAPSPEPPPPPPQPSDQERARAEDLYAHERVAVPPPPKQPSFVRPASPKVIPKPLPEISERDPEREQKLAEALRDQQADLRRKLRAMRPEDYGKQFISIIDVLGVSRENIVSWFDFLMAERIPPPPTTMDDEYRAAIQLKIDALREEKRLLGEVVLKGKNRTREFLRDGSYNPEYVPQDRLKELRRENKNERTKIDREIAKLENERHRKPPTAEVAPPLSVPNFYTLRQLEHTSRVQRVNDILRDRGFTFGDWLNILGLAPLEYKKIVTDKGDFRDRHWENKIIQNAIMVGILYPTEIVLKECPWISALREQDFFREEEDGTEESQLILKTGGAHSNSSICGGGLKWHEPTPNGKGGYFTRRALHSLDADAYRGGNSNSSPSESDDEDPEEYQPS